MIPIVLGTIVLIIISVLWAEGIDYMKENHPDYKGEDFFGEEEELKDWDVTVGDGIEEGLYTIIPKEEPKKVLTEEDIFNQKDIDAVTDYIGKETSKQETTIEEAGDRELSFISDFLSNNVDFVTGFRTGMLLGAKWQQERSYSEEEVLELLHKFGFDYTYNYKGEKTIYEWIPEWFEEYKRLNN
jgi:hypothetical protein